MSNKIQVKRGVEANLPTLDVGEPAFTTDTKKPFIGSDSGNVELATKAQINDLDANKADGMIYKVVKNNPVCGKYNDIAVGVFASNINGGGTLSNENIIGGDISTVSTANNNTVWTVTNYDANTAYVVGDVVLYGATTYRCILNCTGVLPTQISNWENVNTYLCRILGGYDNVVNGITNSVNGDHCKIDAPSNHCAINGGANHFIDKASFSVIGGGIGNEINGDYAVISGGNTNKSTDKHTTIAGGTLNITSAQKASIGGGSNNLASGINSVISGGTKNIASGQSSFIGGGLENKVEGIYSTIVGGTLNVASGLYSTIVGGINNIASGNYSTVYGNSGKATYSNELVHAGGKFLEVADAQASKIILRRQTIDDIQTRLSVDNTTTSLIPPDNSTWGFECMVVARRTDSIAESVMWEIKGLVQRSGSVSSFIGTPSTIEVGKSATANYNISVAVSGPALHFLVTGEAGKTVNWLGKLNIMQLIG